VPLTTRLPKALILPLFLSLPTLASAHMPYLLPTQFELARGTHVTVQASFGEDALRPEVAMRDAPFHVIGPDGARHPVGPITYLRELSIFEAELPADGTWKLTSGQRAGRKGKMVRQGDAWVMRGEGAAADAQAVEVQSMTLAEAYVTRGRPSDAALKPRGEALEIQPLTHPGAIVAGGEARFRLLFDGKPLADTALTLFRNAGYYDGKKIAAQLRSDAEGQFSIRPEDAGAYLILVRHRGAAPAGAETPYRSYTYTLTFDAA